MQGWGSEVVSCWVIFEVLHVEKDSEGSCIGKDLRSVNNGSKSAPCFKVFWGMCVEQHSEKLLFCGGSEGLPCWEGSEGLPSWKGLCLPVLLRRILRCCLIEKNSKWLLCWKNVRCWYVGKDFGGATGLRSIVCDCWVEDSEVLPCFKRLSCLEGV